MQDGFYDKQGIRFACRILWMVVFPDVEVNPREVDEVLAAQYDEICKKLSSQYAMIRVLALHMMHNIKAPKFWQIGWKKIEKVQQRLNIQSLALKKVTLEAVCLEYKISQQCVSLTLEGSISDTPMSSWVSLLQPTEKAYLCLSYILLIQCAVE